MTNSFQHISGIRRVIKERATFTSGTLFLQCGDITGDHRSNYIFWTDTFQVLLRRYAVQHSNLMENSRTKIEKLVGLFDSLLCFLLNEFVTILSTEVFFHDVECFFVDAVMDRFTNTKDHVKHKVPVIVVKANETLSCVLNFLQLMYMVVATKTTVGHSPLPIPLLSPSLKTIPNFMFRFFFILFRICSCNHHSLKCRLSIPLVYGQRLLLRN